MIVLMKFHAGFLDTRMGKRYKIPFYKIIHQVMGCCGQAEEGDEDKRARKQNKEIEKQIQKDKQVNNSNKRTLSLSL